MSRTESGPTSDSNNGNPNHGVPFLSIVVPAYNEVHSIARTLVAMRHWLDGQGYTYEIIVSADGNDGTREKVAEMAATDPRIQVIGSAERGGKGRGVRNGILRARGQIVGFCDADYKTPIEELEKILPPLLDGADIAIGSRAVADSKIVRRQPLYRRAGSRAFKSVMRAMMGLYDIADSQCGFKFFRREVARDLFSRQRIDGYMFDVEILLLARQLGYTVKQVGVRWQDDGDSRYDPILGTWRNAREMLKIRFARRARGRVAVEQSSLDTATSALGGAAVTQ